MAVSRNWGGCFKRELQGSLKGVRFGVDIRFDMIIRLYDFFRGPFCGCL